MRVGETSVEHMLPDTSMVSIMVVWLVGTATIAAGRRERDDEAGDRREEDARTADGA